MKRVVDAAVAAVLLLALSPLLLLIALAVMLTSPGPALFRQERAGRGKRPFTMLKFRTMRVRADDAVHREFVTRMLAGDGPTSVSGTESTQHKLTDDGRITRVGRWLRRSSLDELPQLVNVLCGEMSLVGPRPMIPWEVELIGPEADERFAVKPGMTGLWQVKGRNTLSMREALELDVSYVKTRSALLDLRILLVTIPTVLWSAFTGRGVG